MRNKNYRLSEEERKTLERLIGDLEYFCKFADIPMFVSCAIENNEETTGYYNAVYTALPHGISLTEDQITEHMKVATGRFCVVLKREELTVDPAQLLEGLEDV